MSLAAEIRFALKVARPGFWSTTLWFFLLPLGQRDVFGSWVFWLGMAYVTFPLGYLLYGWNDLFDAAADRHNLRKDSMLFGARGSAEQLRRLPLRIALVQLPFAVAFVALEGSAILVWFAVVVLCNAIYNWPRWGFKNHPGLDLLNQTAYLLVFVLSSWLNHVPQLPWPVFVFGALFAMHSHLFGQVMDLEPDRAAGRRTTAVVLGILPAKLLIVAFMAVESALVWVWFADLAIAGFLLVSAVWFALDALLVFRERGYTVGQMRLFLLGWNAVAFASMHWVWARGTFVGI